VSHVRNKRKIYELDSLKGQIRNLKSPTFDGEKMKGDDVETWWVGIKKYFHFHMYSFNLEARISIDHWNGKHSMWWDQLNKLNHID
jgi:hypothetical protein